MRIAVLGASGTIGRALLPLPHRGLSGGLSPCLTGLPARIFYPLDLQHCQKRRVSGLRLHMARVNAIDSAGLGELTVVYTMASKHRCPILLITVSPSVRRMLELARLEDLLP